MDRDIVVGTRKLRGCTLVTLQSGDTLRVPGPLARQFPLQTGDAIDAQAYMDRIRQHEYAPAAERAARLLSQRDYSSRMLEDKLHESGYAPETIERVLTFLQEKRYLDDHRFAEDLMRRRLKTRGRRAVQLELHRKGIAADISEPMLSERSDEEELAAAAALLEKYLRGKVLEPQQAYQRSLAYLARRGYGYEIAKRAYALRLEEGLSP